MDSKGDQYGRGRREESYELDSRGGQQNPYFDGGDGQGGQGVVSQQPGPMGFHGGPALAAPPGLEYLTQVDQLLVHQKIEACEIITGCETKNHYTVKNSLGQTVYSVKEDTGCCNRQCCGPIRPFDMLILDGGEREVLHLNRPLRCQGCCYPCCLQQMEVTAGPGGPVLGAIHQQWTLIRPKLAIHRPDGEHVFTIGGPICKCALCTDVDFPVMTADGTREIGMIRKNWSGFCKELCSDGDNFGITFPMDLDVGMKATLFAALFLVDFMYFERSN